jgi:hypothetical protein
MADEEKQDGVSVPEDLREEYKTAREEQYWMCRRRVALIERIARLESQHAQDVIERDQARGNLIIANKEIEGRDALVKQLRERIELVQLRERQLRERLEAEKRRYCDLENQ